MVHENVRAVCPLCGNDRVIQVTTFRHGEPDGRKAFCAGSLGCHAWWNVETEAPTGAPTSAPVDGRGLVVL